MKSSLIQNDDSLELDSFFIEDLRKTTTTNEDPAPKNSMKPDTNNGGGNNAGLDPDWDISQSSIDYIDLSELLLLDVPMQQDDYYTPEHHINNNISTTAMSVCQNWDYVSFQPDQTICPQTTSYQTASNIDTLSPYTATTTPSGSYRSGQSTPGNSSYISDYSTPGSPGIPSVYSRSGHSSPGSGYSRTILTPPSYHSGQSTPGSKPTYELCDLDKHVAAALGSGPNKGSRDSDMSPSYPMSPDDTAQCQDRPKSRSKPDKDELRHHRKLGYLTYIEQHYDDDMMTSPDMTINEETEVDLQIDETHNNSHCLKRRKSTHNKSNHNPNSYPTSPATGSPRNPQLQDSKSTISHQQQQHAGPVLYSPRRRYRFQTRPQSAISNPLSPTSDAPIIPQPRAKDPNRFDIKMPKDLKVPRHQRPCHKHAEVRRRKKIENYIYDVKQLVPSLGAQGGHHSQASVMIKTADYIKQLKKSDGELRKEIEVLRSEVAGHTRELREYQRNLPESGAVAVTCDNVETRPKKSLDQLFDDYVTERCQINWRFWIFSIIARQLFESFSNNVVNGNNWEEFSHSVSDWVSTRCTLSALRPVFATSMRHIGLKTNVLAEPNKFKDDVQQKLCQDLASTHLDPESRYDSL
ncbi:uncharacterized protein LOC141912131 [Tubulanus polymorphus]|uniref:uncharacterized protein LOC141912131 n=1 Tax=Tubulanus polymorphus TaxID=672921 RepID=UPI003DA68BC7